MIAGAIHLRLVRRQICRQVVENRQQLRLADVPEAGMPKSGVVTVFVQYLTGDSMHTLHGSRSLTGGFGVEKLGEDVMGQLTQCRRTDIVVGLCTGGQLQNMLAEECEGTGSGVIQHGGGPWTLRIEEAV